jgi:alpha-D-ribose 1-methylphosphonate 5-triphosphate diphosphatase
VNRTDVLAPGLAAECDPGAFAVRDVRAVLPDRVLDGATVVCENGVITDVRTGGPGPDGAVDGRGALLIPGVVDVHSDALEVDVNPRPGTSFPIDFALGAFEGRVRAAGVTTVFHGVGFYEYGGRGHGRTLEQARAVAAVLRIRAASARASVTHRVLHRMDIRSPRALDVLVECLPEPEPGVAAPLVSVEDHTPGQGQFRDIGRFAAARAAEQPGRTAEEADRLVRARIEERDALLAHRDVNLARLADLAREGRIRLVAHDPVTAADVVDARARGARVAEFPTTMDAARAARELGLPVVMGAPNVLRGGSHSGNVSAREVAAAGLVDALASDYSPPTLLAAALELAAEGLLPLPAAVGLVTAGPARSTGLNDRGSLAPGQRGDLVLVDDTGRWPQIRRVFPGPG